MTGVQEVTKRLNTHVTDGVECLGWPSEWSIHKSKPETKSNPNDNLRNCLVYNHALFSNAVLVFLKMIYYFIIISILSFVSS